MHVGLQAALSVGGKAHGLAVAAAGATTAGLGAAHGAEGVSQHWLYVQLHATAEAIHIECFVYT